MISLALMAVLGFAPSESADSYLAIEKLTPNIYAAIRKEPPGLAVDCNVTFIVNERDVVVVDTNIGPESASATLRALRKITNKPVRYVINTHYHDDHIGGNETFKKAFPGVEFIGSESFAENLSKFGVASRKGMIETAPQMTGFLRKLIEKKKGYFGTPITEEERVAYLNDIRIADRYAIEMPLVHSIEPDILVHDKLTLKRGERTIEILNLGSGHTGSDLVVNLPQEHIAVTGDLIVWPVPLIGSPQSTIGHWPATLRKLLDLHTATLIPGHGPVLHDKAYPELLIRFFDSVNKQVGEAISRGEKLEQVQKSINLEEFEIAFAGDSQLRRTLFAVYCQVPSVSEAFLEQSKK